MQEQRLQTEQT